MVSLFFFFFSVGSCQLNTACLPIINNVRVEQPVGTGFATGTPTATSQEETAEEFVKFFKNFQKIFGIKNFKIYVTGESYAGRYVPYISAAMLDKKDKQYYDLKGWFLSLQYSSTTVQSDIQQVPWLTTHVSANSTMSKSKSPRCLLSSKTPTSSTSMPASWRNWSTSIKPAAMKNT